MDICEMLAAQAELDQRIAVQIMPCVLEAIPNHYKASVSDICTRVMRELPELKSMGLAQRHVYIALAHLNRTRQAFSYTDGLWWSKARPSPYFRAWRVAYFPIAIFLLVESVGLLGASGNSANWRTFFWFVFLTMGFGFVQQLESAIRGRRPIKSLADWRQRRYLPI